MAAIVSRTVSTNNKFSLSSLAGAFAAWNDTRMTRNALNKLSARELADIGVGRGDIEYIARGNLIR